MEQLGNWTVYYRQRPYDGGYHKVISEHVSNVLLLKEREHLRIKGIKEERGATYQSVPGYQKWERNLSTTRSAFFWMDHINSGHSH